MRDSYSAGPRGIDHEFADILAKNEEIAERKARLERWRRGVPVPTRLAWAIEYEFLIPWWERAATLPPGYPALVGKESARVVGAGTTFDPVTSGSIGLPPA